MARVFVSHASADLPVAVEVQGWLQADGHAVFLDRDPEEGLQAGEAWKQRLYAELRAADVVVCTVSAAFVESPWCAAEVGIADCLGCQVVPIQVDGTAAHPLMETLQYADYQADRDRARQELVAAVRRVDTHGGRWREGQNPFPGLEAFTAEWASMFFGREPDARRLAGLLRSPTAQSWTVVTGPSGCGKSSLLQAGVLPLLDADRAWIVLPPMAPGTDPVAGLARQMATAGIRAGRTWSLDTARNTLNGGEDGLRRLVEDLLTTSPAAMRTLLPVDQAEELFTRADAASVDRFARLLAAATGGPVRVVATLRSEFLGDLRRLPGLAGVGIEAHPLAPLDRDMLRLAVEEPARRAGLVLRPELTARLLADTGSGDALPLLAFTLHELAEGHGRGDTLSGQDYERLGGVHGSLARQADAALTAASTASGLTEQQILTRLVSLATLDDAGRYSRRQMPYDPHSPADVAWAASVGVFVEHRLLTTGTDNDGCWVAVAHEAFLNAWPPLAAALREHADLLRAHRSVEQAAAEWTQAGQADHHLWDADRLAVILTATGDENDVACPANGLSAEGQAFLAATRRHVAVARTRRRRQLTAAFTVLSVLLVTAVAAAVTAVQQQRAAADQRAVAEKERESALSRLVAITAGQVRSSDPSLAMQLSLVAYQTAPTAETRGSLLDSSAAYAATRVPGGVGTIGPQPVALSPDGHLLAAGSPHGGVLLTDVTDPQRPATSGTLQSGSVGVFTLAFHPAGTTLAVGGVDWAVRLWDVADPKQPRLLGEELTGAEAAIQSVAFSPGGNILAAASADGTIRLWGTTSLAQPAPLGVPLAEPSPGGAAPAVRAVAFSPDGTTLVAGRDDGTVRLWDVGEPQHPVPAGPPLTGFGRTVFTVTISPDGNTLAAGDADGAVRLWDIADVRQPGQLGDPLVGAASFVNSVAFSRDGRSLAAASSDGTVQIWDLRTRRVTASLPHPAPVTMVAFTPDGHTLATGATDGATRLWALPGPILHGPTDKVFTVAFSLGGDILAAGSNDGKVWLWDVTDPQHSVPLDPLASPAGRATRKVFPLVRHPMGLGCQAASSSFTPCGHAVASS